MFNMAGEPPKRGPAGILSPAQLKALHKNRHNIGMALLMHKAELMGRGKLTQSSGIKIVTTTPTPDSKVHTITYRTPKGFLVKLFSGVKTRENTLVVDDEGNVISHRRV